MRPIGRAGSHVCAPSVVRVNQSTFVPVPSTNPARVSSPTA